MDVVRVRAKSFTVRVGVHLRVVVVDLRRTGRRCRIFIRKGGVLGGSGAVEAQDTTTPKSSRHVRTPQSLEMYGSLPYTFIRVSSPQGEENLPRTIGSGRILVVGHITHSAVRFLRPKEHPYMIPTDPKTCYKKYGLHSYRFYSCDTK